MSTSTTLAGLLKGKMHAAPYLGSNSWRLACPAVHAACFLGRQWGDTGVLRPHVYLAAFNTRKYSTRSGQLADHLDLWCRGSKGSFAARAAEAQAAGPAPGPPGRSQNPPQIPQVPQEAQIPPGHFQAPQGVSGGQDRPPGIPGGSVPALGRWTVSEGDIWESGGQQEWILTGEAS